MTDLATRLAPVARPLPPRVARAAARVAEALFHDGTSAPPAERIAWLEADLVDFVGRAGARAMLSFRALVFANTWVAPLASWRLPPLGRLSVEDRVAVLTRFERIPVLNLALLGLKALLCIVYYEHPGAAREIHFDGHPSFVADLPGHERPVQLKTRPKPAVAAEREVGS